MQKAAHANSNECTIIVNNNSEIVSIRQDKRVYRSKKKHIFS